jgi:hypothetical protein
VRRTAVDALCLKQRPVEEPIRLRYNTQLRDMPVSERARKIYSSTLHALHLSSMLFASGRTHLVDDALRWHSFGLRGCALWRRPHLTPPLPH